ncbi:MAG: rRNA maturation RNase YbeY [Spirochaetales bacterium]|nr:rRNA maturation RNase YbeY [Spirochaetales bacterium]
MNEVEISTLDIEPPPWIPACKGFIEKTLAALHLDSWELSLVFCDDASMKSLNSTYRHKEETTDVLSFPQENGPAPGEWYYAGDIVISLPQLEKQAREWGVTVNEELKRLIIHGILHLKGMDHETNSADEEMLLLQERLLSQVEENIL